MFIGRERELKTLKRLYDADTFQFPVIYGRRRVGKTALMTGTRGKPRPSGRGRIARTRLPFSLFSPIFSARRQDMPCQPVERW